MYPKCSIYIYVCIYTDVECSCFSGCQPVSIDFFKTYPYHFNFPFPFSQTANQHCAFTEHAQDSLAFQKYFFAFPNIGIPHTLPPGLLMPISCVWIVPFCIGVHSENEFTINIRSFANNNNNNNHKR